MRIPLVLPPDRPPLPRGLPRYPYAVEFQNYLMTDDYHRPRYVEAMQKMGPHLADQFAGFVPHQPNSILELGCGAGYVLEALGRRWPEASLIGVDYCKEMLPLAREVLGMRKDVTLIEGDFSSASGQHDLIVASNIMAFQHSAMKPVRSLAHAVADRLSTTGSFVFFTDKAPPPLMDFPETKWFFYSMSLLTSILQKRGIYLQDVTAENGLMIRWDRVPSEEPMTTYDIGYAVASVCCEFLPHHQLDATLAELGPIPYKHLILYPKCLSVCGAFTHKEDLYLI